VILIRKALASAVNVGTVLVGTSPFYGLFGFEVWRVCFIALFFLYALLLSRRCLGQMTARTYQNEPTNAAYALLYTASTATLLYWIWVPLDLALVNGIFLQVPCLMIFGNTVHGLLARRQTMTEPEYLFACIMKGRCPDCYHQSLAATGSYVHCRSCHAEFYARDLIVQRVQVDSHSSKKTQGSLASRAMLEIQKIEASQPQTSNPR
jgi:hypothetical protein